MGDRLPTHPEIKTPKERLKELFPSCETDCTDGCKYGCLGWLHRFPAQEEPVHNPEVASNDNE